MSLARALMTVSEPLYVEEKGQCSLAMPMEMVAPMPSFVSTSVLHRFVCECAVNPKIPLQLFPKLEDRLRRYLTERLSSETSRAGLTLDEDEVLAATIDSIRISSEPRSGNATAPSPLKVPRMEDAEEPSIEIYLYPAPLHTQSPNSPPKARAIDASSAPDPDAPSFYRLEVFPAADANDAARLWDSLLFANDIKEELLAYVEAVFEFAHAGLTTSEHFAFNRLILLHGPPGTGKSTLARALASKVSVRLCSLQRQALCQNQSQQPALLTHVRCYTLNSSNLFSRFFSESSKLIQQLFEQIRSTAESPNADVFIVVIVDEVESLAMSRAHTAQSSSAEPTDSIRAVNTLLTQLDHCRSLPNILFLATSNHASLIDPAFLDRVDLQHQINPPSPELIYGLLAAAIERLVQTGMLTVSDAEAREPFASWHAAALFPPDSPSHLLRLAASELEGSSGRALKKLPLIIYARLRSICTKPSLAAFVALLRHHLQPK